MMTKYKCPICRQGMGTKKEFLLHMKEIHNVDWMNMGEDVSRLMVELNATLSELEDSYGVKLN